MTAAPRKVLIVSPCFPPLNAPDMQRVRMSLPYYRENGWEPIILTVSPELQDRAHEDALLATLPADLEIHRCGALPAGLCHLLGIGNLGLRSWLHLFFAGFRLIRRKRVDLVFFSNTQFVSFTLGRLWRRSCGVPYVIDLQDPWRTDYYERPGSRRPPGGWKYQLARLQAWLLEGWSFRRMDGFMAVSENYVQELRQRYRWFKYIPSEVIRFGASEHDLAAARALPQPPPDSGSCIRFVYTGAAGPIMPHALRVLFSALKRFRQLHPGEASRLHFEFLGTSYATGESAQFTVLPEAKAFGVEDQVTEVAQRLGHLECLGLQARADVLLLLGSSDLAYSPSKLYPYFLAGRPMLSVVFADSVLAGLLRQLNCSVVAEFRENEPKDSAEDVIAKFFLEAVRGFPAGGLPERNDELFRKEYLASALTEKQCQLFERALQNNSS